jgi:hypothetical protein
VYRNKALHSFTKTLIDVLFFAGIITCLLVPFLVYYFRGVSPMLSAAPGRTIAVLLVSGTLAVYILWEFRCIFRTIVNRESNPFITANVTSLRRIAAASAAISVTYVLKCLYWFTMATAIIIIIFALATLFCLVLADVFEQAVTYKQENDLTV